MKWSIVIVMVAYVAMSLWSKVGISEIDGIVDFWINWINKG